MRNISFTERLLVTRCQGSMPLILTCPHGGDKQPPRVQKKRTGAGLPADCRFESNTDRFTRTVARGVAQLLFDVFGETPYVVMADFDRAYIDANRSKNFVDPGRTKTCAFEDRDAEEFYDEYHNTIRGFVDEIREDHGGQGLLIDVHGTTRLTSDPADVYPGTLNGLAITNLLKRDPLAMSRRRSVTNLLRAAGYVVSSKSPESLPGDFTLETYGSSNENGVDAIQFEIETALRTEDDKRNAFIEDLAFAISNLASRYSDSPSLVAFRTTNFLPRLTS